MLHCHPQLGINKKDKAENIKSFGKILSDLLDCYQHDHDDKINFSYLLTDD